MSIVAREVAPLLPFNYQPEGETVSFRLRGLSTSEMLDVQAYASFDPANASMNWTRRAVEVALGHGLLGWEGFATADGVAVALSKKPGENIERLGIVLTMQLFGKIMEASSLNEAAAKN